MMPGSNASVKAAAAEQLGSGATAVLVDTPRQPGNSPFCSVLNVDVHVGLGNEKAVCGGEYFFVGMVSTFGRLVAGGGRRGSLQSWPQDRKGH